MTAFGSCPVQIGQYDHVVLGHGSGGRLTQELVSRLFLPAFHNETLAALEDQATLSLEPGQRLALTTDSFVVSPLCFPGGDIGKLAVCGTVNDLAVGGAQPLYLAASFILEEGLPLALLSRVVQSMREACDLAGVKIVTGDTKVVERGKADGLFITTTGVGALAPGVRLSISAARPGDAVLVSGPIGDHGITILSVREGLSFDTELLSDCAPLYPLAKAVLRAAPGTRCMRDPTRGGVASALNELAVASRVGVRIHEAELPVRPEVKGACELLGLDPLYVANEGKLLAIVPPEQRDAALQAMRAHPLGDRAQVIGEVVAEAPGKVRVRSALGAERVLPLVYSGLTFLEFSGEKRPLACADNSSSVHPSNPESAMSVSITKERSSGIPGAIVHGLTTPVPATAKFAAANPKYFTQGMVRAGVAVSATVAGIDTFIAIKNGLDKDASAGKKVLSAATAAASVGTTAARLTRHPVLALASAGAALAGGIFRDIME